MILQVTIVVVAVPEGLPLAVTLTYVYFFHLLNFLVVKFLMIVMNIIVSVSAVLCYSLACFGLNLP